MKTTLMVAMLALVAATAAAQDQLADRLRKGIVEEETGKNLEKAIHLYEGILADYDQERKTAATALFRLAECYRKVGKRPQAIAAYRRVVAEFADQTALVASSRQQLNAYGVAAPEDTSPARASSAAAREAREQTEATRQIREQAERSRMLDAEREARVREQAERIDARMREELVEAVRERNPRESLEETKLELAAMRQRLQRAKELADKGMVSPSEYEKALLEMRALEQRYAAQAREWEAERVLTQQMLKSVQAEKRLVEERVAALEARVKIGALTAGDTELLQLRRELLVLERKFYELEAKLLLLR